MRILLPCLLGTLSFFAYFCVGFPDGAPVDACALRKPNRPNHAGSQPRAAELSKYTFTASSSTYRPGQIIEVKLSGQPFKGFFVQARDYDRNKWIGKWATTNYTKKYDVCSAITHNSKDSKTSVTLAWKAPITRSGRVYFTGTILQNYDVYWSEVVAKVPNNVF